MKTLCECIFVHRFSSCRRLFRILQGALPKDFLPELHFITAFQVCAAKFRYDTPLGGQGDAKNECQVALEPV